jgi:hypothetical protein
MLFESCGRAHGELGTSWDPTLPLIVGVWWNISDHEKKLRVREHIEYAASDQILDAPDGFLGGLTADQLHFGQNE